MNKEAFEKRFTQPLVAAPVPKVKPTVKKYPKYKSRIFIAGFIGVSVFFGILIFFRGYFLQNPPNFDNENLLTDIYKKLYPNTAQKKIKEKIETTNNLEEYEINQIKSSFPKVYEEGKLWLSVKNDNNTFVGYLDSKDIFNQIYKLPAGSLDIRLYQNELISYFVNADELGELSTLFFKNKTSKTLLAHEVNENEAYVTHLYEPTNKLFYYTSKDKNDILYINSLTLEGENIRIYESTYLSTQTKIISVDSASYVIYLQDKDKCHVLGLKAKNLFEIGCEYVKRNDSEILYFENANDEGVYSQYLKGEIYQTVQNSKIREIIINQVKDGITTKVKPTDDLRRVVMSGNEGEIFSNLAYYDSYLWFLKGQLIQKNTSLWQSSFTSIEKIDVKSNVKKVVSNILPKTKAFKIIPTEKNLYAIVEGDFLGHTKLVKYYPNGTYLYEPASYPTSFPVSYSSIPIVYWKDVNLNIVSAESVELIGPEITL
jgi:hypothetical protein